MLPPVPRARASQNSLFLMPGMRSLGALAKWANSGRSVVNS